MTAPQVTLADLTVIIPTFERAAYLRRALSYWMDTGAKVIVADGSANSLSGDRLAALPSTITYLHRPIALQLRLREAAAHVTTAFAMLCSDDEFMIPTGLLECIRFLQGHSGFSVCSGRVIGFRPRDTGVELFPLKLGQRFHSVDQPTAAERIEYHIGNYQVTTIYGVHRSECLRFCIGHAMSEAWSNAYAGELGMELLAAAHGKSAVLSVPSWLRSRENAPVSLDRFDRTRPVAEWLTAACDAEETRRFTGTLVTAACQASPEEDSAAIERAVHKALLSVTAGPRGGRAEQKTSFSPLRSRMVDIRERWRPHPLFRIARRLYRAATGRRTDNAPDFFTTRQSYKFSQLRLEHGVEISELAEQELVNTLSAVCEFHLEATTQCA